MRNADTTVLAQALERLREVDALLDNSDAGVCLIHLDACIASLESRIAKLNAANGSNPAATATAAVQLGKSH